MYVDTVINFGNTTYYVLPTTYTHTTYRMSDHSLFLNTVQARALARTRHTHHFDVQLAFLTGKKLPFLTKLYNFSPFWAILVNFGQALFQK